MATLFLFAVVDETFLIGSTLGLLGTIDVDVDVELVAEVVVVVVVMVIKKKMQLSIISISPKKGFFFRVT